MLRRVLPEGVNLTVGAGCNLWTSATMLWSTTHKSLVPLLGKQSAHDVDKLEAVQKQGFGIVNRHGAPTLADAYGVVALKIVSVETAGDHHLALCEVVAHETLRGEGEPLYTGDLPKT